ncbi:MAG: hypothetical protein JEZ05_01920 [Tenericutes bacterium]|nr:hypothetical protein [Mycoplasmatota bacterium]
MKKKILLVSILSLIIFGLVSANQHKAYAYSVDENLEEEKIGISKNEQEFFDKKTAEQKLLETKNDIMIVDTINNRDKETITVKGVEYEKDALIYSVYSASANGELEEYITEDSKNIDDTTKLILQSFQNKAISEDLSYNDIAIQFDDSKSITLDISLVIDMLPKEVIIDSSSVQTKATYYYETVYVGYYETYNYLWTDTGIYSIQAEYYKDIFGNTIYTGSTRYVLNAHFCTYDHINTVEFDYQSYSNIGVDGSSAPLANIHLIYDYWGKEKMILESDDIGVAYKISQEVHYDRNQYNKINGLSVDVMYSSESEIPLLSWTYAAIGNYFHKLLLTNSDNNKYTKSTEYYDVNLGVNVDGSLELVCDENGDVEYEDLVTFTFNFGVGKSDPEVEVISDAHYIRDVYPYLIWGNSVVDYNNHTPFERFIWDKASLDNNITARNAQQEPLTDMYYMSLGSDNSVDDNDGTIIPLSVQNNACRWDIFFNYIPDQYIEKNQYTNYNWALKITGQYSDIPGIITKFEEWDSVIYNRTGEYLVMVGIEDSDGNKRTQIIKVIVSSC